MGVQNNWPCLSVFVPGYQFERVGLDQLEQGEIICARTLPTVVTVGCVKIPDDEYSIGAPVLIEFIVKKASIYYRQNSSFRLTPAQAERYYRPA